MQIFNAFYNWKDIQSTDLHDQKACSMSKNRKTAWFIQLYNTSIELSPVSALSPISCILERVQINYWGSAFSPHRVYFTIHFFTCLKQKLERFTIGQCTQFSTGLSSLAFPYEQTGQITLGVTVFDDSAVSSFL